MCFDNMAEIEPSIIISITALIISGITSFASLYYFHLQNPVLRIEHLSKKQIRLSQKVSTSYEHIITVINEGNKVGIIKQITAEVDTSDSTVSIERLKYPYVYRGAVGHEINEDSPYAVIPIAPKESVMIKCSFKLNRPLNEKCDYSIIIVVDKNVKIKKIPDEKRILIYKE